MHHEIRRIITIIGSALLALALLWLGSVIAFSSTEWLTAGIAYGIGAALLVVALLIIVPTPGPYEVRHSEIMGIKPPEPTQWAAVASLIALSAYAVLRGAGIVTLPWLKWFAVAACVIAAVLLVYIALHQATQKPPKS